jgi:phytoene synthase
MNAGRDTIQTSYRFCRRMSRRAGSSFHAGFLLLPWEKRQAMEALYAFMRHTDDLADKPEPDRPPREALTAWRAALDASLRGDSSSDPPSALRLPLSSSALTLALSQGERGLTILPALADAMRRFCIPHEHLYAVIDGVEMDLDGRRYETFGELQTYCERVASAVGLACIHIWGFRGPEAFEPARRAGIALQLTNILRDVREDADAGRVYLPLADLRQCDYSADNLLAGVADPPFRRLMALEVARAERFYDDGRELMDWLDPAGRRIFGLMMATYRSLLRKIQRHPADVFRGPVRLSSFEKVRLVARWWLLPPRKADLR